MSHLRRSRRAQAAPGSRRNQPIAGTVLIVVGVGLALWLTACVGASQSGAPSAPAAPFAGAPPQNGIPCDTSEHGLFHIHAHLAIYHDGESVQVPYGIGIGEPWGVEPTTEGPFVVRGSCFSWLHTHTGDGIIHIESPVTRTFTLGDFFAVWGQPLGPGRVGAIESPVTAYVNGERFTGDPSTIPLAPHAVIQLNVGADRPGFQDYSFAPGL